MKFVKRRKEGTETPVGDRWVVPYADLVTLLLALFVVLFAAAGKDRATAIAASFKDGSYGGNGIFNGAARLDDDSIAQSILGDPVLAKNATVKSGSKHITISLTEAALFEPGEADIAPASRQTIIDLAALLAESKGMIRIEGHTDSRPISNRRFRSNWELSTARASSVLVLFAENGIPGSRLSAAGYGGFRPKADNTTPEGRQQNRRVDIIVETR